MDELNTLKLKLKQMIVTVLELEDTQPEDIADDLPLFDDNGLGLDSIDALELGVALRKQFQVRLEANDPDNRQHFRSVDSLARLVASQASPA